MFGLSGDQKQNPSAPTPVEPPAASAPAANTPASVAKIASSAPSAPTLADPMVTPLSALGSTSEANGTNSINMENGYIEAPAQVGPAEPSVPGTVPTAASMITSGSALSATDDGLAQIRQQAIKSLAPLVGHLEQAPEEKFKTLMMLIQASDNSNLLNDAYEAANKITDEKTRAQALLDVVNEINYFTHQAQGKQ